MYKLKRKTGESIAETLVAVLILSLAFLMLSGAVVTAANVNKAAKNEDVAFSTGGTPTATVVRIEIDRVPSDSSPEIDITLYETGNGYYYYEATP